MARVGTTRMNVQRRSLVSETLDRTSLHGRLSGKDSTEKERVVLPHFHPDLPRASSHINDSYCITKLQTRLLARSTVLTQTKDTLNIKLPVVPLVTTAPGQSQKKDLSPGPVNCQYKECKIKICEKCFLCHSIVLCQSCYKCAKCCPQSSCRGQTSELLENLAGPRRPSKGGSNPQRGLHPPLSDPTQTSKISNRHKLLWQSPEEQLPAGGITSAYRQKCSRGSKKPIISELFNRLFLVPKPNNRRPILDLSNLNFFLKAEKFKMETPETIRTSLQQGEWITSIDFKDAYFHIPIQEQSRKYLRFYVQGQTYQFKALPFGLSTAPLEFTVVVKEVKLMAIHKGIRIHQYLDWLVRAESYQICLQHTQELVQICQNLGWIVNLEKSELEPKQIFNFVGYQFDLKAGRVRPTPDWWQILQEKIFEILSLLTCPVRQFMSLIGLLTATEKQVYLGRLHMRPIQWHLKNNWRVPETLEKVIPVPRSLHPHLEWWLDERNVLQGQPLHPIKRALQIFTDASKERWGAHLGEHTVRGSWSVPESNLHINYLELKAVFLALKEFQDLCTAKIVLVATDNTTVAAYINKEGGMRSGPLCALLWRILTWCTNHQVTLKARHIPGSDLNGYPDIRVPEP